jgi:uncharacterized protein (TIGR02147 family)
MDNEVNFMETTPYYIEKIKDYLSEKQRLNSLYSLRAFSRDINLHSSTLSQVLKGKRPLPIKIGQLIADKMKLDNKDRTLFLESINRTRLSIDDIEIDKLDKRFMLDDSYFKVIAEWEHYAVLSLFDLKDFTPSTSNVATRLNLTEMRAAEVMTNLETSELVIKNKNGQYKKVHEDIRTTEDISSRALDESHLETIEIGKKKIELPKNLRDFSSSTIAVDMEKLPEAKTIIREFRQKMTALLKDGNKTEVFQLAIQFYPLTHITEVEETI